MIVAEITHRAFKIYCGKCIHANNQLLGFDCFVNVLNALAMGIKGKGLS